MLWTIGVKRPSDDVVDRILSCHARIRHHAALAVRLASAGDAPADQVADAAAQVHRYFSRALPLHAADEDRSLAPRVQGLSPDVDAALAQMAREHAEHEPALEHLLRLCEVLRERPERLGDLAQELGGVAGPLQRALEQHLELEERVVFPAARERLTVEERETMRREMDTRHR